MRKKMLWSLMVVVIVATMIGTSFNTVANVRETRMHEVDVSFTPLNKVIASNMDGNVKISTSSYDDITPTITRDANGNPVVAYATQMSVLQQNVTLVYSPDHGSTWQALAAFTSDAGILQYPSLDYVPETKDIALSYMDPSSDYQVTLWRIGDVTDSETYNGIRWGLQDTDNYEEIVTGHVHYIALQFFTCHEMMTGYDIQSCPHLAYWTQDLNQPDPIGGIYFDGQSILKTAPASNLDIATGSDYFYLVMQHYNETTGHNEIALKKTVTNLDELLTQGGGPGGMDKYADIEAMPWQMYVAKEDGYDDIDPSIAASGHNVVVVYMNNNNIYGDWDIMCAYSSDDGETWQYSKVTDIHPGNEEYPAVYMSGSNAYCVYIANGNLYLTKSTDGGATWGEPVQINNVDGKVVAEPRSVDITEAGIVWEDTRDGNKDIYYAQLPAPRLEIGLSGGFGLTVHVENNGQEAAKNVNYDIELSGLVFMGKSTTGTIDELAPGTSQDIKVLAIGIGPVTASVTVGGASATAKGFLLGPLLLGLK